MIITFFGNSEQYDKPSIIYNEVFCVLNEILKKCNECTFYCGCKGFFDAICDNEIRKLKLSYPRIKQYYITPYFSIKYQKEKLSSICNDFNGIIFPDALDSCPPRLAYLRRNQWMIDNADIILSYVAVRGGGAEKAIKYAVKKNKKIIPILNTEVSI